MPASREATSTESYGSNTAKGGPNRSGEIRGPVENRASPPAAAEGAEVRFAVQSQQQALGASESCSCEIRRNGCRSGFQ